MTDRINELASILANTRASILAQKSMIANAQEKLEQLPEYRQLQSLREELSTLVQEEGTTKSNLSLQMLSKYKYEGLIDFPCGKVINRTIITVSNEQSALNWAMERKICIKLDESALKKVAKELRPDGVTITQEPTTRIDSDLSAFEHKDKENG
jgi:hypothetical protein